MLIPISIPTEMNRNYRILDKSAAFIVSRAMESTFHMEITVIEYTSLDSYSTLWIKTFETYQNRL